MGLTDVVLAGGAIIFAYLLGSVPSGFLIGKWTRGVDIRAFGSGRTGATNAMRSLGGRGFALTFVADVAKALTAVAVAQALSGTSQFETIIQCAAGLAVIAGHNWPVFLRFSGGRGVACSFGAMLILYWPGAVIGLVAGVAIIVAFRYVSLGSMAGTIVGSVATAGAVAAFSVEPIWLAAFGAASAALVVFQHRDNIQRLLAGTERRIGSPA